MTSPSPSPSETTSPSPSPSPSETVVAPSCDQWQGLYATTDEGGCYSLVRHEDEWMVPAVFFAVIVTVCLVALVIAQLRRG